MTTSKTTAPSSSAFEEHFKNYIKGEKGTPDDQKGEVEEVLFIAKDDAIGVDDSITDTISSVYGVTIPSDMPDLPVKVYSRDEWDASVSEFIPDIDKAYVWQGSVRDLIMYHAGIGMSDNIYMYGDKAVGKSSFVEQVCARTNQPFIRMNGRGDLESSAVFGQYTVRDGATEWNDGMFTIAAKTGAVFLLDEATSVPSEVTLGLQYPLEKGGKLFLTDKAGDMVDKIVNPDPRHSFVVCDNTNGTGDMDGHYSGTTVWNSAILDRFATIIKRLHMSSEDEVNVLRSIVPELTPLLAGRMVQFAGLCRNSVSNGELGFTVSLRTLESWGKKAVLFNDPKSSLKAAYYERLGTDDERQAVNQFYNTTFGEALV
jgi:cobaltochelatase CobS